MVELHLSTRYVRVVNDLPTGVAVISKTPQGEPTFTIARPAAFDDVSIESGAINEARGGGVDWIYYGTLLQTASEVEHFTTDLIHQLPRTHCFYDMNLRTGQWNLPLIQRLSGLASVLKLNEDEAQTLYELTRTGDCSFSLEQFSRRWAATYGIDVICITLGPAGCLVYENETIHNVPGYSVKVCDTVGSGDAFAAAFLHGYHQGWPMVRTARFANALGALVASRAGATPGWTADEVFAMALD
jgi:fructokinase